MKFKNTPTMPWEKGDRYEVVGNKFAVDIFLYAENKTVIGGMVVDDRYRDNITSSTIHRFGSLGIKVDKFLDPVVAEAIAKFEEFLKA